MKYIFIALVFLLGACGEGLEPNFATFPENQSTIYGTITFKGQWPPIDSLKDLRVIGIKNFPPKDFQTAFFSGDILFTESSLDFFTNSVDYVITIADAPLTVEYLAVAQNYGGLLEWKSVGVYQENDVPNILNVEKGKSIEANFTVDFDNLPQQPF